MKQTKRTCWREAQVFGPARVQVLLLKVSAGPRMRIQSVPAAASHVTRGPPWGLARKKVTLLSQREISLIIKHVSIHHRL